MRAHYDAVIVGARCAGASTAMLLARAGLDVLAIDRDPAGTDTLSTHALMRGGVLQLARWGLLERVVATGAPPVRTTTFHYGDEAIEIAIKPRDGIDALFAPRRTVLDALLQDAARSAGAEIVHGARAMDIVREADGRVRGIALERDGERTIVRADLVIGADGRRSRLARLVGAPIERRGRHAVGVIYGYYEGLEPRGFHWHYAPGAGAGVIPTNDGRTCVFAGMPAPRFREQLPLGLDALHHRVLEETSPELARATRRATLVGPLWPFPGLEGFLRRPIGPGWALVGDAGFFRDPITAHGITDALRDAELLARAIVSGDLASYAAARDEHAAPMLDVSDAIASFEWDLEQAKVLHLELSRLMNAEVATIREWGPGFAPAPACPFTRAVRLAG